MQIHTFAHYATHSLTGKSGSVIGSVLEDKPNKLLNSIDVAVHGECDCAA